MVTHLDQITPLVAVETPGVEAGDVFSLSPGQIAGLSGLPGSGLTKLGLSLIAVEQEMAALVSRALQRRERRKKPGRRKSGGKNTRARK